MDNQLKSSRMRPDREEGSHRSSYLMMLNNITNDLDILLSEFCDLQDPEPGEPPPNRNRPMRIFGKKPVHFENCSAFGGSSTSGTLTSTDSNISNKDVHSGTLTSTDSNISVTKPHNYSLQAAHLNVFELSPNRALEPAVYPDKQQSLSRSTSGSDLRQITVLERLTKTHPIWFLPQVGRSGAVHLLKNRDIGIFIVRKSSRDDIMALSVQFPSQDGTQNVDHYLIEPTELGLHLQGSSRLFNAIPNLIAHYCDNKEDLPHRLVLPTAIRNAKTSQELTALAMLGQDFWTSSKYDALSCSSSRSNLSEHSSIMNKSHSEPISISNKNHIPAYSQSDSLIQPHTPPTSQLDEMLLQHTPPKHSVIDFSSYLIQKPSKTLIEIAQHCSHQNLSSISESVHSKCSVTGSKSTQSFLFKQESSHVTTKSHATKSSSLHKESIPKERMVLHVNDKENRVDIHIAKRDSQISVPYAKPHKKTNKTELEHESVSVDYLHIPEEFYFRSNLSDKLSDYEDIWKNNYADPKVGCVQADILYRLQPNLVNGNGSRSPTSPIVTATTFHEQCFNHKCLTTDLNVSLDKLTISNDLTATKDVTEKLSKGATDQTTTSAPTVSDPNAQKPPSVLKRQLENGVICTTPLHGVAGNRRNEALRIDAVLANAGSDCILEHDLDIDSNHGDSCHSDNDAEADTEDPDAEPQNSVHTQTSLSWKLKSLTRCARKSVSTSSLSAMKSPVYSEPFDAISPEEKVNGQIPRIPKKLRRRSAPAIGGMAKRRLPSTECSKLSPFVYEREKTAEESAESDTEILNDVEDVFQISLELKNENGTDITCENNSEHTYGKAWVEQISAGDKDTVSIGNKMDRPKPIPRKSKVKKANLLQEALINQRNKQEATIRNSQNDSIGSPGNIMDQFQFLDDLDENQNRTSPTVGKFPLFYRQVMEDQKVMYSEGSTAEDIITSWNPELTLRPVKPFPVFGTLSEYDNLNNPYIATSGLSMNSAGTTFCNPWENSVLGKIMKTQSPPTPPIPVTAPPTGHASPPLPSLDPRERIEAWRKSSQKYHSVQIDTESEQRLSMVSDVNSIDAVTFGGDKNSSCNLHVSSIEQHSRRSQSDKTLVNEKSTTHSGAVTERCTGNIPLFGADFQEKVAPVHAQSRIVNKSNCDRNRNPDRAIRDYIISLSNDRTTTFGSTIENFIQCTLESQDTSPHNITRNVRQFMTGIKNYLVKHGEGELEDLIERERNQLGKNEILNIDAIIEGTLHACVLQPLKQNIYRLFVNEYTRNGNLRLLSSNIKYARTKTAEEIGIRNGLSAPDGPTLELIKHYFNRMQKSYSPLKKLEHLLAATSSIYKCVGVGQQGNSSPPGFGADDFLPMLIYVLVQCGMVSVEIEADYMWGLLHPSLLNGEGGYYLTSLSSAVLVLKNFREMQETKASHQEGKLPSISDMQGFLKIAIPDEQKDTIVWRTLPVRPSMTTRDVCSMIAHKFKITNPQDYGLYTLEHGEEHKLMEMESPQTLKADRIAHRKDCIFAYKRNAANIAWPKSVQ